jgi:hypothetical protein
MVPKPVDCFPDRLFEQGSLVLCGRRVIGPALHRQPRYGHRVSGGQKVARVCGVAEARYDCPRHERAHLLRRAGGPLIIGPEYSSPL